MKKYCFTLLLLIIFMVLFFCSHDIYCFSSKVIAEYNIEISYINSFNSDAFQGVTSDGIYIYTINELTYKYNKSGELQTSRDVTNDDSSHPYNGDLCYYNGYLYIARHTLETTPSERTGSILKLDASDLSQESIIATEDNHAAGAIARNPDDGSFWVISLSCLDPVYIYKYNSSWVYQGRYELEVTSENYAYEGIEWIDGYLFANIHGGVSGELCYVYIFNGKYFSKLHEFSHIFNDKVCGQGLSLDPTDSKVLWWAERGDSSKVNKTRIIYNHNSTNIRSE
jgi:hypothetical protein